MKNKKKCYVCGETKEVSSLNFWKDKSVKGGYCNYCKKCGQKWTKIYAERKKKKTIK